MRPFKDSFIRMTGPGGIATGSVCDVIAAAEDGRLGDLPAMRAQHRGQAVTLLGALLHVARRYGHGDMRVPQNVERAFAEVSDLPLYWEPGRGPAFLQMSHSPKAAADGSPEQARSGMVEIGWQQLEPSFFAVGLFAVASEDRHPSDEDAMFALMSAGDRQYVNCHPAGARWGLLGAFHSTDCSVGSEIKCLADLYDAALAKGRTGGHRWKAGQSPRDHMPFLLDPGHELRHSDMSWPPIDTFRSVWLAGGGGRPVRANVVIDRPRCSKPLKELGVADPHVAKIGNGPLRASMRAPNEGLAHQIQFGRSGGPADKQVEKALAFAAGYRDPRAKYVRIVGTGLGQGKTVGFRERIIRVSAGPIDLAGEASAFATEIRRRAKASIKLACENVDPLTGDVVGPSFEMSIAQMSVDWVDSIADRDGFDDGKPEICLKIADEAMRFYRRFTESSGASGHLIYQIALGHKNLVFNLSKRKDSIVNEDWKPARDDHPDDFGNLAVKLAATVGPRSGNPAKRLRTLIRSGDALATWEILAELRLGDDLSIKIKDAVKTVAFCAAVVPHAKVPSWKTMERLDLPRIRVERLLEENGEALREMVLDVAHLAATKGVPEMSWWSFGGLVIADAAGDAIATERYRAKVALDYSRNS